MKSKNNETIFYRFEKTSKNFVFFKSFVNVTDTNMMKNTLILGGTGSGKTKSVLLPFLNGFIEKGLSGLIIDVKNTFTDDVYRIRKKHNRLDDIIEIGDLTTSKSISLFHNIETKEIIKIMEESLSNLSMGEKNNYFLERGKNNLNDCIYIYCKLYEDNLFDFIVELNLHIFTKMIMDTYFTNTIFYLYKEYSKDINKDEVVHRIELEEFSIFNIKPNPEGKTTKSEQIEWNLSTIRNNFKEFYIENNVYNNFCNLNSKDFTLDFINLIYKQNKIIVLRFSPYSEKIGNLISNIIRTKLKTDIIKYSTFTKEKDRKYTFNMIDEFQNIINLSDKGFNDNNWFDKCREYKNLQVVATQSISSLYSISNNKSAVDTLIRNCRNKILLNLDDPTTLNYFLRIRNSIKLQELSNNKSIYLYFDEKTKSLISKEIKVEFETYSQIQYIPIDIDKSIENKDNFFNFKELNTFYKQLVEFISKVEKIDIKDDYFHKWKNNNSIFEDVIRNNSYIEPTFDENKFNIDGEYYIYENMNEDINYILRKERFYLEPNKKILTKLFNSFKTDYEYSYIHLISTLLYLLRNEKMKNKDSSNIKENFYIYKIKIYFEIIQCIIFPLPKSKKILNIIYPEKGVTLEDFEIRNINNEELKDYEIKKFDYNSKNIKNIDIKNEEVLLLNGGVFNKELYNKINKIWLILNGNKNEHNYDIVNIHSSLGHSNFFHPIYFNSKTINLIPSIKICLNYNNKSTYILNKNISLLLNLDTYTTPKEIENIIKFLQNEIKQDKELKKNK